MTDPLPQIDLPARLRSLADVDDRLAGVFADNPTYVAYLAARAGRRRELARRVECVAPYLTS